jgi:hypothetical protein
MGIVCVSVYVSLGETLYTAPCDDYSMFDLMGDHSITLAIYTYSSLLNCCCASFLAFLSSKYFSHVGQS